MAINNVFGGEKSWLKVLIWAFLGIIFVVGLVTAVRAIGSWLPNITHKPQAGNVKTVAALDIKKANYAYLKPNTNDAWTFNDQSTAYDATTGVVKYALLLKYSDINVVISQQKMPAELKPRGSSKFMNFINGSNPTRSQETGKGTLYYLAALENGAPANGADTVIYATDDILMFGKSGRVVSYDVWAKLMSNMQPR